MRGTQTPYKGENQARVQHRMITAQFVEQSNNLVTKENKLNDILMSTNRIFHVLYELTFNCINHNTN